MFLQHTPSLSLGSTASTRFDQDLLVISHLGMNIIDRIKVLTNWLVVFREQHIWNAGSNLSSVFSFFGKSWRQTFIYFTLYKHKSRVEFNLHWNKFVQESGENKACGGRRCFCIINISCYQSCPISPFCYKSVVVWNNQYTPAKWFA